MRSTLCLSALHCRSCVTCLENLFQAPQGERIIWQGDSIGVARFIDACLERVLALSWGTRHLISPELAGKDVTILLLLLEAYAFLCTTGLLQQGHVRFI